LYFKECKDEEGEKNSCLDQGPVIAIMHARMGGDHHIELNLILARKIPCTSLLDPGATRSCIKMDVVKEYNKDIQPTGGKEYCD